MFKFIDPQLQFGPQSPSHLPVLTDFAHIDKEPFLVRSEKTDFNFAWSIKIHFPASCMPQSQFPQENSENRFLKPSPSRVVMLL